MYAVLLEDSAHAIITSDMTAICRILKIVVTDVLPYPFDCLWTRKLIIVSPRLMPYIKRDCTYCSFPVQEFRKCW